MGDYYRTRSNNGPRDRRGQYYMLERELKERDERALRLWEEKLSRLKKDSKDDIAEAERIIARLKKDIMDSIA